MGLVATRKGMLPHVKVAVDEVKQARMRHRNRDGGATTDAAFTELLSVPLDTRGYPPAHQLTYMWQRPEAVATGRHHTRLQTDR